MINNSPIFKKIFINTSSQIIAKGVTVVLGFLTVGLLTRYLGVAQYGVYNLVFAYLAFFGIFADFGLQLLLIRDFSSESTPEEFRSAYFALKIILTTISTFLALILLLFFPYSMMIKMAILVGSLAVGIGYMNGYGASVLQSKVKLDTVALLEVINRVITVAAIITFVWLKWNIYAVISTILIGNIVTLVMNIYISPEYFRLKRFPAFSLLFPLIKSYFPVGITSLLAMLYFKIDTMMLSVMKTTIDVGIYSLSYKLFENIIMIWIFYMASVYPLIVSYIHKNDRKNLRLILKTSFIVLVVSAFVTLSAGLIAAPIAIDILGGKNFVESILPFRILLFALPFVFLNNIIYFLLLSFLRIKWILLVLLISLVFNFIVNLFVIPQFSYIGTSVSTVVTEAFTSLTYFFVLAKLMKFSPAKNLLI